MHKFTLQNFKNSLSFEVFTLYNCVELMSGCFPDIWWYTMAGILSTRFVMRVCCKSSDSLICCFLWLYCHGNPSNPYWSNRSINRQVHFKWLHTVGKNSGGWAEGKVFKWIRNTWDTRCDWCMPQLQMCNLQLNWLSFQLHADILQLNWTHVLFLCLFCSFPRLDQDILLWAIFKQWDKCYTSGG